MYTVLLRLDAAIDKLESEGRSIEASLLQEAFVKIAAASNQKDYVPETPEGKKALSDPIVKKIIEYVKTIKHIGDYGTCWWNPITRSVHWTAADSDGSDGSGGPDDLTSLEEIENTLSNIDGVNHVEIGDEWSPSQEDGFFKIYQ